MNKEQIEKMLALQAGQLAVLEGIMQNLASLVSAHGRTSSIQNWGRTETLMKQARNLGKPAATNAPLDFRAHVNANSPFKRGSSRNAG